MYAENATTRKSDNNLDGLLETMARKIDHFMLDKGNGLSVVNSSLTLHRYEEATELTSFLQEPAICLLVQGKKRVLLGDEEYLLDNKHYLTASVDLPVVAQVVEASKEEPYLGITLRLDRHEIAQMIDEDNITPVANQPTDRGLSLTRLEMPLAQAFLRLITLLAHPEETPVIAPLIYREVLYRILTGNQNNQLFQIITAGSRSHQVAQAIEWLKKNYSRSFKLDELATVSGMSASSLRYHFQIMTAMSPLQFQKKLRLYQTGASHHRPVWKQEKTTPFGQDRKNYLQLRQKCSRHFARHCQEKRFWN